MDHNSNLEFYLQNHIEEAIQNGYIEVHYQPVIRTLTGKIVGYEALARWNDSKHGFLQPNTFISVLENCKKIHLLDLEVLRQICAKYHDFYSLHDIFVPISFNLSRMDFDIEDIHERINQIVDEYNVPHNLIHIEITESISYVDKIALENHIKRFHSDNYDVLMDDFGSGFSTLNTLQFHSFDTLKLDMMFMRNINKKANEIIRSIVRLSKKLNMGTICEGVETKAQLEFLKSIGCEKVQGWYFGKPNPFSEELFLENLKNNKYETKDERIYWDKISRQDITSSLEPWIILESDDDKTYCSVIDCNEAMKKKIYEIYPLGYEQAMESLSKESNPLNNLIRSVLKQTSRTKNTKTIDFIDNNSLVILTASYIASLGTKSAAKVTIRNIRSDLEYSKHSLLNTGLIGLYSQFILVNLISPEEDTAVQIYSNASFNKIYGTHSLTKGIKEFTENEVYIDDQKRYLNFMNMDTIEDRLLETGTNFITEAFRLHDKAGSYKWRLVTLLKVPSGVNRTYLYEIQEASHKTLKSIRIEYGDKF